LTGTVSSADRYPSEAHLALGDALVRTGGLDAGIASYRQALRLDPDNPEAHTKLSRALYKQGLLDEAESACRRAIELAPDHAEAYFRLGKILLARDGVKQAFEAFTHSAEISRSGLPAAASEAEIRHKSAHDREQRQYLSDIGIARDAAGDLFHLATAEGAELSQSALAPGNTSPEISEQWRNGSPKIVVLDDFLTDEALQNLRRFCWRSTIWQTAYRRGYLVAFLRSGISCPLLGQIAEELRLRYPAIFGSQLLRLFWGVKYDSTLNGAGIHADIGVINVNFWITPDESNLDPESGGLVIWDKPAPSDWSPTEYNSADSTPAQQFLEESGARSVTIPYRSNRAVIFDSSLFHATDDMRFKEGYLDRRINLTLLYGKR
jgi:hypothetical protein